MQHYFIKGREGRKATLFFTGWSLDYRPLLNVEFSEDIHIFYSYGDIDSGFDASLLEKYSSVRIVGFSMGVWAADRIIGKWLETGNADAGKITDAIAVNGTPCIISDSEGIPETIYDMTCDHLDSRNLRKFRIRICGGNDAFRDCLQKGYIADDGEPEYLKKELSDIRAQFRKDILHGNDMNGQAGTAGNAEDGYRHGGLKWTQAWVSSGDMIFSAGNQKRYWEKRGVSVNCIDGPHYQPVLIENLLNTAPATISRKKHIDKQAVISRFTKAMSTYDDNALMQRRIAERLASLVGEHISATLGERPATVLEIGCGTGYYTQLLEKALPIGQLILNDICPESPSAHRHLRCNGISYLIGDAETLPLPEGIDLITSCSAVQWFEDLGAFLHKCSKSIAREGYLAISTFGPDNLLEIRRTSGKGLDYYSSDELTRMVSEHFTIICCEESHLVQYFDSPKDVLMHLRNTGVTATGNGRWSRTEMEDFTARYIHEFSEDGKVRLTYHPVYIIAKKK